MCENPGSFSSVEKVRGTTVRIDRGNTRRVGSAAVPRTHTKIEPLARGFAPILARRHLFPPSLSTLIFLRPRPLPFPSPCPRRSRCRGVT